MTGPHTIVLSMEDKAAWFTQIPFVLGIYVGDLDGLGSRETFRRFLVINSLILKFLSNSFLNRVKLEVLSRLTDNFTSKANFMILCT